MSYNIAKYVLGWLFEVCKMQKMAQKWLIYLEPFSTDPPTRHTQTYTDDGNRRECNVLHFA